MHSCNWCICVVGHSLDMSTDWPIDDEDTDFIVYDELSYLFIITTTGFFFDERVFISQISEAFSLLNNGTDLYIGLWSCSHDVVLEFLMWAVSLDKLEPQCTEDWNVARVAHWFTCRVTVHVQVVPGLLMWGVVVYGLQVHSALECHKTRWLDHVQVTVQDWNLARVADRITRRVTVHVDVVIDWMMH